MVNIIGRLFRSFVRHKRDMHCSAVIVAAGSSERMNGADKILSPLCGEPVLIHTLRAFENAAEVTEIVLVVKDTSRILACEYIERYGPFKKLTAIVDGGQTRAESVMNGIKQVSKNAGLIAVHDGARPLVTSGLIHAVTSAALKFGSAVPAVRITSTVKRVKDGMITSTEDRETLYAAQTPQIFDADVIRAAVENAVKTKTDVTDDSMCVELLGASVRIVEGEQENIKITVPADLEIAETFMNKRKHG